MKDAGFYDKRITLYNHEEGKDGDYGREQGEYVSVGMVWANWSPGKGKTAAMEQAREARELVVVRTRYTMAVNDDTRVMYKGKMYQQVTPPIIQQEEDEIQMTVTSITSAEIYE